MTIRSVLAASLILATTSTAHAQAAGQPAAPAAQPLGGPVVAGVCLLSREAIYANAAIGKAASTRLTELARAAQAEVDGKRPAIETEARALQGQPDNAQTKAKRDALGQRWSALQAEAAHSGQEIDATRSKALARIATEAQPIIAQVYTAKKCGLLLDRGMALGGNFANDLTADVVRALDAKIQTITFERERLPKQAAPAPAPAPR